MMKTVLLMRHAKSSWKHEDIEDIDRPLSKRGKNDAPMMGSLLKKHDQLPQLVLSSSAKRTRQTAKAVTKECGCEAEIQYLDSLYLAEPQAYIEAMQALADDVERVLVIGHNPGLEGLVQLFSGRVESMPTSAVAVIDLSIKHWKDLSSNVEGNLVALWQPDHDKKKKDEK